jgi:DNA-directed RNA polymerase specialized sigma24 family protein
MSKEQRENYAGAIKPIPVRYAVRREVEETMAAQPWEVPPSTHVWTRLLADFEKHNPNLADSIEMMRCHMVDGWSYAELSKEFDLDQEAVRSRIRNTTEAVKRYFMETMNGKK